MADVFISYHQDTDMAVARRLAAILEGQGWSVFWDRTILPGQSLEEVLDAALATAKAVVVLWSRRSVRSDRVKREAKEGSERGILVPVALDRARPPRDFRGLQAASLSKWAGDDGDSELQSLLRAITAEVAPSTERAVRSRAARTTPIEEDETGPAIPVTTAALSSGRRSDGLDEYPLEKDPSVVLVRIPGGTSIDQVEIAPFLLARTPITNAQYERFLRANADLSQPEYWTKGHSHDPDQPVVGVSWDEAVAYCEWARCRLPSEAEWEYACRAGTTSGCWCGDSEVTLAQVGWYDTNSGNRLHAVGEKLANPWGLYDMLGNVWEWCQDEVGGSARVIRGGSWPYPGEVCRPTSHGEHAPSLRWLYLGFRPARHLD